MTKIEILKEFKNRGYTYNPETGDLIGTSGKLITSKCGQNYIRCAISINGKYYQMNGHVIAWYLFHGENPNIIDHIDGNGINNKISNLRNVNVQINTWNCYREFKGYCWDNQRNKWKSNIRFNNKPIYLGHFDTEQEAHQAYLNAKEIYHKID